MWSLEENVDTCLVAEGCSEIFHTGKTRRILQVRANKNNFVREEPVVSVCMCDKLVSDKPGRKLKF